MQFINLLRLTKIGSSNSVNTNLLSLLFSLSITCPKHYFFALNCLYAIAVDIDVAALYLYSGMNLPLWLLPLASK